MDFTLLPHYILLILELMAVVFILIFIVMWLWEWLMGSTIEDNRIQKNAI